MKKTLKVTLLLCLVLLAFVMVFTACNREEPTEAPEETQAEATEKPTEKPTEAVVHTHTWGEWTEVKKATCQEHGEQTTTCTECGATYTQETEFAACVEQVVPAVSATCTQAGLTEGKKCAVCATVMVAQEEVPATGHLNVTTPAVAPTCTEKGATAGEECGMCHVVLTKPTEVPALGHTMEVTTAGKAATCTETGLTDATKCKTCGHEIKQETIPAKGHTEVETVKAVAATCSSEGTTQGKKCSVCNTETLKAEPIAKLPHAEYENNKCVVCGADKIFVVGENSVYYTAEEIEASEAERLLAITENGTYGFISDTWYEIYDAEGTLIECNEFGLYELAAGEYVVKFLYFGLSSEVDTPYAFNVEAISPIIVGIVGNHKFVDSHYDVEIYWDFYSNTGSMSVKAPFTVDDVTMMYSLTYVIELVENEGVVTIVPTFESGYDLVNYDSVEEDIFGLEAAAIIVAVEDGVTTITINGEEDYVAPDLSEVTPSTTIVKEMSWGDVFTLNFYESLGVVTFQWDYEDAPAILYYTVEENVYTIIDVFGDVADASMYAIYCNEDGEIATVTYFYTDITIIAPPLTDDGFAEHYEGSALGMLGENTIELTFDIENDTVEFNVSVNGMTAVTTYSYTIVDGEIMFEYLSGEYTGVTPMLTVNEYGCPVSVTFGPGQPFDIYETWGGDDGEDKPVDIGEYFSTMYVETTDNYCWIDLYEFTAMNAGEYTFVVPSGLGIWNKEGCELWTSDPELDYYGTDGGNVTLYLEAGETFEFYVASTTTEEWEIDVFYKASNAGGEEPVESDTYIGKDAWGNEVTVAVNGDEVTFTFVHPRTGMAVVLIGTLAEGEVVVSDGMGMEATIVFEGGVPVSANMNGTDYTFGADEEEEEDTVYTGKDEWNNEVTVEINGDEVVFTFVHPRTGMAVVLTGTLAEGEVVVSDGMGMEATIVFEGGVPVSANMNGTDYTF